MQKDGFESHQPLFSELVRSRYRPARAVKPGRMTADQEGLRDRGENWPHLGVWTDEPEAVKGPSLLVVVAIAVIAIAATAGTILVSSPAITPARIRACRPPARLAHPPYGLCGLFAWYRQPESRFGPLMIAAGFVTLLSSLSAANSDLVFTIGTAFDLVPFAVFMHVFLAFPTGALQPGRAPAGRRDLRAGASSTSSA